MLVKLKNIFFKKQAWLYWLTLLSAVLITWTGITLKQQFYHIFPLYISLLIGVLQSRANRYASLLGSFNCLIYTVVNISLRLYASAASALLITGPLQLATFIRWSKQPYKQSTRFRRMCTWQWILVATLFVLGFITMNFILSKAEANSQLLDSLCSLLGFFASILSLLSFQEYSWFMLTYSFLGIGLNASMLPTHPAHLTYVIYAIHSFICMIQQFICVRRLYKEQTSAPECNAK
jgi:nicotinamide mononucleotide transporter PnuC